MAYGLVSCLELQMMDQNLHRSRVCLSLRQEHGLHPKPNQSGYRKFQ